MGTKNCFVIMPFSATSEEHPEQYWTNFFTKFLKPEMEGLGYKCERSKAVPANIISTIIKQLCEADVVVAVLTDFNANVWYELGIRHSFKKGTIMVIEDGQKLPSDITSYGVIKYNDGLGASMDLRGELKSFIERIESKTQIDNPVQDFIEKENLHIHRTSLTKVNELLEGINWANVPLTELIAFPEPKFYFHILNKESSKVIDLKGSSKGNGGLVHLWWLHDGENQIWEIHRRFGNLCSIMSKHSNKCLEVENASANNEAQIQQNDYKGLKNQLWELLPNDDGSYRILVQSCGKCLEADAQTVYKDGGRVIQYEYANGNHQKWILKPIPIKFN